MLYCGIDLGTQGARCLLVDDEGVVCGEGSQPFGLTRCGGLPAAWFEQEPREWLAAVRSAWERARDSLGGTAHGPHDIAAVSVTSTSGTLCVLGGEHGHLRRPIMYSDARSVEEAERVQDAGSQVAASLGYRFKPSFALPKILWLKNHEPEVFDKAAFFVSPTDYIIGWLTGVWGRTDQTNALKYGYDLLNGRWPEFVGRRLGVPLEKMPAVQMTGEGVGAVLPERASELGLPAGVPVAAGLTDGCASQVASGAVAPGDFNTTIGTTLVIKGVSEKLLLDPQGRMYCHKHPAGWWLPGGASNTGAECVAAEFSPREVEQRSRRALEHSPTDVVAYPLVGKGERFPFASPDAMRFVIGDAADRNVLFAAFLEGVACLERLAFEVLEGLGGAVGRRIYSAGGGARSDAWLQIRADVLDRTVARPAVAEGAMGAAIVAAALAQFGSLSTAARSMVRIEKTVRPRAKYVPAYAAKYERFREECLRRGYIRD